MADTDGALAIVNRDEAVAGVRELLLSEFDLEVGDDTNLIETGYLDSLDVIRLIVAIEKRFGFNIEMADVKVRDIGTVNGLAALVARHA